MHNEPLDEVVYCEVMFDDGVSGEVPEHRDFIYSRAIPFLERNGIKVVLLRSGMTFLESFYRVLKKRAFGGKNQFLAAVREVLHPARLQAAAHQRLCALPGRRRGPVCRHRP